MKDTPYISTTDTISALLRARARQHPDHVFCRWQGGWATKQNTEQITEQITYRQLDARTDALAAALHTLGVRSGSRVAVMLAHHPDHIVTLLALVRMGAVVVPVNPQLRGASLRYVLDHAEPQAVIADTECADSLSPELPATVRALWRNTLPPDAPPHSNCVDYAVLAHVHDHEGKKSQPDAVASAPDGIVAICYTSGTTGPPKGALVTDKMCRCAAHSSTLLSGMVAGDTALFWDPLHHLFGIEVVVLALLLPVTLAMVERFSVRHFWQQAAQAGATHMHYVGGVIPLLLKQPPSALDRRHGVRIAWGGGCPAELWQAFEQRFGVQVRDSFGMTETSALNLINTEGIPGSVGRALPYFDVKLVKESGQTAAPGETGELWVRGKEPGLITPAYFKNPGASARLLQDGWLHTGDLLSQDAQGRFAFVGRLKDCVRRRGENVSAWEVERVVNQHPDVVESALVSAPNALGDEDLKLFVQRAPGSCLSAAALVAWCAARMPRFHVPRFVAFVDAFEKTSTQRIQKFALSRRTDDCWDAEKTEENSHAL